MLEFLVLFSLVKSNRKNALARGRRPGGFVALTIILWVHFELIGLIIGLVNGLESYLAMIIGLLCAGLGGLISWLCAKFWPKGNYVASGTQPVSKPQYGTQPIIGSYNVPVDSNGYTPYQQSQQPQQYPFDPVASMPVQTYIDPATGNPVEGIVDPVTGAPIQAFVPSPEAQAAAAQHSAFQQAQPAVSPYAPVQPQPAQTFNFCPNCGKAVAPGSNFCDSCGSRLG